MKLSILGMQTLEYALKTSFDNPVRPWYKSNDGMFAPTFFRQGPKGDLIAWTTSRKGFPASQRQFTEGVSPVIFDWFVHDFYDPDDRSKSLPDDSQTLLDVIKTRLLPILKSSEASLVQTSVGQTYQYPISHLTMSIKYENGLLLEAVELTNAEYDLVGFERS
jgi:hypothetical protein